MAKERRDKKKRLLQKGEYQNADGRYEFHYTDINGKKQKVYSWCLTETDKPPKGKKCEKCLRILEAEIQRSLDNRIDTQKARKLTLDALFEENMAVRVLKDSTRENYTYIYKKYISPVFGSRKVTTIKYSDIIKFYTDLIEVYGFKPNSMEVVNTILHPIFQTAVKDDILLKNPSDGAMAEIKSRRDWTKPKRKALGEDEQQALVNFVSSSEEFKQWLVYFTVFLGTGMRVGELVGLCWNDCDFENNIIYVRHELVYRKNSATGKCEFHVTEPKSKAGIREIPMFKAVKKALLEERLKQMREGGFNQTVVDNTSGFVFSNRFGNVQSPHNLNRAFERIRNAYNEQEERAAEKEHREPVLVPHFSNHNLRHTFCTRFCENESNIKIIQEIMGHSDISTTMDIYAEATRKKKQESFANLEGKVKIC